MRLASFRAGGRDRFGIVRDDGIVDLSVRLGAYARSLRALIAGGIERARTHENAAGVDFALDQIEFLPPIARPGKIVCIGVNYGNRNAEYRDDSDAPRYPSVFMRTPESLVGHGQPILRPPESEQLDYEGEIVLVIGRRGRRIARPAAWDHVAGLSLMNEGSVRDWLRHAKFNVTQGKNFERSGAWGPWLRTSDELDPMSELRLVTRVNGEERQNDTTASLMFPFDYLVSYLSTYFRLKPGDVIATGTAHDVAFGQQRFLRNGDVLRAEISRIGALVNPVVSE